jgi:hypothetical protein
MDNNILETRVKGVNRANDYGNKLYDILTEVFKPFVGKQIIKKTGGLLKKIQDIIDSLNLPCTIPIHVYKNSYDDYSLSYVVKTCETSNNRAYYHETVVYIGKIENRVLTKIDSEKPNFKADYKAEEIRENRKLHKELQKKADSVESKLFPFGTYDR